MSKPDFVYVTYIETTPEKLWQALADGDFTERYWFGHRAKSDWKAGSFYQFTGPDDHVIEGKVLTSQPHTQLSYTWESGCAGGERDERPSRVTFDLKPNGKTVRLTVTHDQLDEGKTLRNISNGWPIVLAGLKSLLETGRLLVIEPPSAAEKEAPYVQA